MLAMFTIDPPDGRWARAALQPTNTEREVEADHLVPALGPGVGHIGGETAIAGHVDQHVEAPGGLDGGGHGRFHGRLVEDVGDGDHGVGGAGPAGRGGHPAQVLGRAAASTTLAPAARVKRPARRCRGWPR